ncbi:hypothetical protein D6D10_08108 [Aureobasidium pullulans]|uniref:Yeast cell wall synthesis Kre9/Knh1-like N-terminal domain-containing protein n=1 Tax=Aureobasidium pullulans TaxID=5580 RepID=A0A4S9EE39_AURPU|nr:hypothetical protein D6D10_08108 [Aureobasidium pullulans]
MAPKEQEYMIMSFRALFTAGLAAFAPLVSAYTTPKGDPTGNAIYEPGLNSIVPVGKPFTITWEPDTKGKVSLVLLHGPSTNVKPIATIVESIDNTGSYDWTPDTGLAPNKTYYGIELIVEGTGQYQYSTQFGISNDNYKEELASTGASTASATTTVSVNIKSPVSAAAASASDAVSSAASSASSVVASASSSAASVHSSASSAIAMSASAAMTSASVSHNSTVHTSMFHPANGTVSVKSSASGVAASVSSSMHSGASSASSSMSTASRSASRSAASASGSASASASAAAQTGAAVKVGAGFGGLAFAAGVVALVL